MAEYSRGQRSQLSRAIAKSDTGSRPLKAFVDNRINQNFLFCIQKSVSLKEGTTDTHGIIDKLTVIDTNSGRGNSDTILNSVCGGDEGLASAITSAASDLGSNCRGVSRTKDGTIYAEATIYNKLKEESKRKVTSIANRNSTVHSEVNHYNKHNNLDSVWTSLDNCYFCSGFLQSNGIKHQNGGTHMPSDWTSPWGWRLHHVGMDSPSPWDYLINDLQYGYRT